MIERVFAAVALLLMAAMGLLFGYWQFVDGNGPVITFERSAADKATYRQGETMLITRSMCIYENAPYVVHRAFVDHIVYQLTDYPTIAPDMGCKQRSIGIEIPPTLPPGRYIYRVSADVKLNPIKTVRVDYPDLTVNVVERIAP